MNTVMENDAATRVRKGNAAARQVASCSGQGNCPMCQRMGVPVLPLRYAVVPSFISWGGNGLPGSLGGEVEDKKLTGFRYVLRTLRKGFVHVYFDKIGRAHV